MGDVILFVISIVILALLGALYVFGGEPVAEILCNELGVGWDMVVALFGILAALVVLNRLVVLVFPQWWLRPSQWGHGTPADLRAEPIYYDDQHGGAPYQPHGGHYGPHA